MGWGQEFQVLIISFRLPPHSKKGKKLKKKKKPIEGRDYTFESFLYLNQVVHVIFTVSHTAPIINIFLLLEYIHDIFVESLWTM